MHLLDRGNFEIRFVVQIEADVKRKGNFLIPGIWISRSILCECWILNFEWIVDLFIILLWILDSFLKIVDSSTFTQTDFTNF